jgi:plasmid stabilization system protein ParE
MPKVVWTPEAEEQLTESNSFETAERMFALTRGLERFPESGRRIPELIGEPEYNILREIILARTARVIYLFVPDSDEVLILGIIPKGRVFRREVLGPYFNP